MLNARKRLNGAAGALCVCACVLAAAIPASAEGWLDPPVSGGTQLHRGLDKAGLLALVTTLRESDRIAIDIEASIKQGCIEQNRQCLVYDVVSTRNADGRKWRLEAALSPEQYSELWDAAKNQGMRPVDIEVDGILHYYQGFDAGRYRDEIKFAALFVENKEGLAWASYSKQTDRQYRDNYNSRVDDQGMTVVDYEYYSTQYEGGPYFAAIFVKDKANRTAISQRALTKENYETTRANLMEKGFWPIFVNSVAGGKYAATWVKDTAVDANAFTTLTLDQMNNRNGNLTDSGYARIDVERRGDYWGSIWMKRAPAARVSPAAPARVTAGQNN